MSFSCLHPHFPLLPHPSPDDIFPPPSIPPLSRCLLVCCPLSFINIVEGVCYEAVYEVCHLRPRSWLKTGTSVHSGCSRQGTGDEWKPELEGEELEEVHCLGIKQRRKNTKIHQRKKSGIWGKTRIISESSVHSPCCFWWCRHALLSLVHNLSVLLLWVVCQEWKLLLLLSKSPNLDDLLHHDGSRLRG